MIALGGLAFLFVGSQIASKRPKGPAKAQSAIDTIDARQPESTNAPELVFSAERDITTLATDGGSAFFIADDAIRTIDDAGSVITLFTTKPLDHAKTLVVDEHALYWVQGGCRGDEIVRLERGVRAEPTVVSRGNWCVTDLVLDGKYLYWIDDDPTQGITLRRMPRGGGAAKVLWQTREWSGSRDLLIHGKVAVLILRAEREDSVVRVQIGTGAAEVIVSQPKDLRRLAMADDGTTYWTVVPFNSWQTVIQYESTVDGGTLLSTDHTAASLEIANGYLWWFNSDKDPDVLMRVGLSGGTPEAFVISPDNGSSDLVFLRGNAYWTTDDLGTDPRLWTSRAR